MGENQGQQSLWAVMKKHYLLIAILCLVAANIYFLIKFPTNRIGYGNLCLALALLLNNIAALYITSGPWNRIIITIVWILLILCTMYLFIL